MTPRTKLVVACIALVVLLAMATLQGVSAAGASRALLGAAALAGLGGWWFKAQKPKKFQLAPRMTVVSKAGLSQRTGLALIDVDGRSFLVVHGDGYAEICPTAEKKQPAPRARRATDSFPKFNPEIAQ